MIYNNGEGDWTEAAVNPTKNIAYAFMRNVDSMLVVDFRTDDIKTVTIPLRSRSGSIAKGSSAGVSLDGKWLLIDNGIREIQVRDAETFELKYEFTPGRPTPVFHPDGNRVFFCEWFDIFERTGQGALWVLNLKTLLMTRVLTSDDLRGADPYIEGLDPKQVEITPDGKFALLLNSNGFIADGPIIKLDLDTYKIVDAFYPRWPAGARKLRIYPIEIKESEWHVQTSVQIPDRRLSGRASARNDYGLHQGEVRRLSAQSTGGGEGISLSL